MLLLTRLCMQSRRPAMKSEGTIAESDLSFEIASVRHTFRPSYLSWFYLPRYPAGHAFYQYALH